MLKKTLTIVAVTAIALLVVILLALAFIVGVSSSKPERLTVEQCNALLVERTALLSNERTLTGALAGDGYRTEVEIPGCISTSVERFPPEPEQVFLVESPEPEVQVVLVGGVPCDICVLATTGPPGRH